MNMKIGTRIKELRKRNNITQEQLAEKLGVTNQAISRWESETGYPDIEYIKPISEFFNVTIDYLFDDNKDEKCMENDALLEKSAVTHTMLIKENNFELIEQGAKILKDGMTVILEFVNTSRETEIEYLNFLKGVIFAIDGSINQVSAETYLLTPQGITVQTIRKITTNNHFLRE